MMDGVSPETCSASYKYGITNFDTLLNLVGFFCMNRNFKFRTRKTAQTLMDKKLRTEHNYKHNAALTLLSMVFQTLQLLNNGEHF
jgi:hypothetical protein